MLDGLDHQAIQAEKELQDVMEVKVKVHPGIKDTLAHLDYLATPAVMAEIPSDKDLLDQWDLLDQLDLQDLLDIQAVLAKVEDLVVEDMMDSTARALQDLLPSAELETTIELNVSIKSLIL